MNFHYKIQKFSFFSRKCTWKYRWRKMAAILSRSQCVNLPVLVYFRTFLLGVSMHLWVEEQLQLKSTVPILLEYLSIQLSLLFKLYRFVHLGGRTWWRNQKETFSALLALREGNPPVTGRFPSRRPVTRSLGVFFDPRLNKRLGKQSKCRWFETPSHSLYHHYNYMMSFKLSESRIVCQLWMMVLGAKKDGSV